MQHFTCIPLFIFYIIFCGDEFKKLLVNMFSSKHSPAPYDENAITFTRLVMKSQLVCFIVNDSLLQLDTGQLYYINNG